MTENIIPGMDGALILLYLFWFFFFGLILYLRREDRREGYPLQSEVTGETLDPGALWVPQPKTFLMPDGSTRQAPREDPPDYEFKAEPAALFPGAPFEPTGDPLVDGVGPAAYTEREDVPDMLPEGETKLAPMRALPAYGIMEGETDPRGMDVVGADNDVAGTVTDVWIDRGEMMIRYLEVELAGQPAPEHEHHPAEGEEGHQHEGEEGHQHEGEQSHQPAPRVLVPMPMAYVDSSRGVIEVQALLADQFTRAPRIKNEIQVTRLEEDRISAYFAGGTLYATADRLEPVI